MPTNKPECHFFLPFSLALEVAFYRLSLKGSISIQRILSSIIKTIALNPSGIKEGNTKMRNAALAVLHEIESGNIQEPQTPVLLLLGEKALFSSAFPKADIWTPYAEEALSWKNQGHTLVSLPDTRGKYQTVILLSPKQKEEAESLLAEAILALSPSGRLIVAAENLNGGRGLDKKLEFLGFQPSSFSKHKSRVCVTNLSGTRKDCVETAQKKGAAQQRPDGLWSCPGLFSWDRLDVGTFTLLEFLPKDLRGKGADLGCGIGEIGLRLLPSCPEIEHLTCVDHDARALFCAQQNLAAFQTKTEFLWADATAMLPLRGLDFVVMNPPFHKGPEESAALGQKFIDRAAVSLKPGGQLWMVANIHLPYEKILAHSFQSHEIIGEKNGFKVIRALQ
jgi:16S rRNA (guanine1207-N2)-methyltransferase